MTGGARLAARGRRQRHAGRAGCGANWAGAGLSWLLGWFFPLGWFGSSPFLPLFFFLSTQNYLNSNEYEFKLLYNQTK